MPNPSPHEPVRTTTRHVSGLLGTEAVISVTTAETNHGGDAMIDAIVATIVRLESVFSAFDPTSDLVRYRSGSPGPFAPELAEVLEQARFWQEASQGAFNPHSGAMSRLWADAALSSQTPDDDEIAALVTMIDGLDYDRSPDLNLNAIAKGWIVDEAARIAIDGETEMLSLWLNLGGDIAHRGRGQLSVAIEDPRTPYDNAAPLATVTISNQAVASSGGGRRFVTVGNRRVSHLLDPRTGYPADAVAGATVIAPSATQADVIATILTVLSDAERPDFVRALPKSIAYIVILVGSELGVEVSPNFDKVSGR